MNKQIIKPLTLFIALVLTTACSFQNRVLNAEVSEEDIYSCVDSIASKSLVDNSFFSYQVFYAKSGLAFEGSESVLAFGQQGLNELFAINSLDQSEEVTACMVDVNSSSGRYFELLVNINGSQHKFTQVNNFSMDKDKFSVEFRSQQGRSFLFESVNMESHGDALKTDIQLKVYNGNDEYLGKIPVMTGMEVVP